VDSLNEEITGTILRILLFIILLIVSGYYVLRFFGRLAGANMFSVMAEGFHTSAPKGELGPRFFTYGTIFAYVLTFLVFFIFLFFLPQRIYYMNEYHAGGLLGYRDVGVKVYDPDERGYVDYPMYFAPLPAGAFTETFEVILLYKEPSDDYYQTTELISLCFNLPGLIAGIVLLGVVYIFLFLLVKDYKNDKLSHRYIAARFCQIVGMAPWKAGVIFLSLFLVIIITGTVLIRKHINHYTDLYESHQKALRSALLKKVSPGDTLTGYVIRRFQSQESETSTTESADGRRTRRETKYYYIFHYTVEFRNLIHLPVYLNLALHQDSKETAMLNRSFPDKMTIVPKYVKDYNFIVNPDYSVSLKGDKNIP